MPFELVHGESLVACAAWALDRSGVTQVDAALAWPELFALATETGEPIVLHDVLCPMTPPGFIADCVARSLRTPTRSRLQVGTRTTRSCWATILRTRYCRSSPLICRISMSSMTAAP